VLQVLYIGKIKVSHKKVPDSFIDDALEKFRVHELEKGKSKIVKQISSHNISAPGASTGSNHNISAAGATAGSSHNISAAGASAAGSHNISAAGASAPGSHNTPAAGDSGDSSQAHTPGNSVVIGVCQDEDHCHRGSLVRLLNK
jgi:TBC1 domain-containing protein 4